MRICHPGVVTTVICFNFQAFSVLLILDIVFWILIVSRFEGERWGGVMQTNSVSGDTADLGLDSQSWAIASHFLPCKGHNRLSCRKLSVPLHARFRVIHYLQNIYMIRDHSSWGTTANLWYIIRKQISPVADIIKADLWTMQTIYLGKILCDKHRCCNFNIV